MADALFAQPRRRVGASEAALNRTLAQWATEGRLVGDAWAVHRAILRDAARAVDAAREGVRSGDVTERTFGSINKMFLDALVVVAPTEEAQSNDPIDSLIDQLTSGPSV